MSDRVLRFPRDVLNNGLNVIGLRVLRVLRGVLTIALRSIRVGIVTRRRKVDSSVRLGIFGASAITAPRCLVDVIRHSIFGIGLARLTRRFKDIGRNVPRLRVIKVPWHQTSSRVRVTALGLGAIGLPREMVPLGATVCYLGITTLLSNQFSNASCCIFRARVVQLGRETFTPRF